MPGYFFLEEITMWMTTIQNKHPADESIYSEQKKKQIAKQEQEYLEKRNVMKKYQKKCDKKIPS